MSYIRAGVSVLIVFHIYLTLTLLACGHGLVPLTYLTYACESLAWGMQYSSYLFVRVHHPAEGIKIGRQMPRCRK
jgi:hypothetical protein